MQNIVSTATSRDELKLMRSSNRWWGKGDGRRANINISDNGANRNVSPRSDHSKVKAAINELDI